MSICRFDERFHIFWKTRSSISDSGVKEFAPNTTVTANSFAYHINISPTISQRLAMSFMKLIRVANIELAAYLIISAEEISVKIIG